MPNCCNEKGLLKICPACFLEEPSESHVILVCSSLKHERSVLFVDDKTSLEKFILMNKELSPEVMMRKLLDVKDLSLNYMKALATLLETLRQSYFSKWIETT